MFTLVCRTKESAALSDEPHAPRSCPFSWLPSVSRALDVGPVSRLRVRRRLTPVLHETREKRMHGNWSLRCFTLRLTNPACNIFATHEDLLFGKLRVCPLKSEAFRSGPSRRGTEPSQPLARPPSPRLLLHKKTSGRKMPPRRLFR